MSIPSPSPFDDTFDTFYNAQQAQRQSSLASQSSNFSIEQRLHDNGDLVEEPHSLSRRGSNASLTEHGRPRSSSQTGNQQQQQHHHHHHHPPGAGLGTEPWRQESWPYDPTSSSTLIATAPHHGPGPNAPNMYASSSSNPQYPSSQPHDQSWQMPMTATGQFDQFHQNQPSPFSISTGTPGTDGSAGYSTGEGYQGTFQAQQASSGWGTEFVNSQEPNVDGFIDELDRIISTSSHPSREPSPAPYQNDMQRNAMQMASTSMLDQPYESAVSSRSASPMPQNIIMPPPSTVPHRASSPNSSSPFFNKPQSPPALIIPSNNQPSFPPIVTTSTDGVTGQAQQNPQHGVGLPRQSMGGSIGLGNVSGGLQPPADPALRGLTGMDGISPIAANSDGPMIFVQPSTPISGLKEGRGLFDAALQRQAQQNQQRTGQASSEYSGRSGQGQAYGQQNQQQYGHDDQAMYQNHPGQWNDSEMAWNGLRAINTARPRAKSDSFMNSPTGTGFNRQAFFAALGGLSNGQPLDENQLRSVIDHWRASSAMMGGDQDGSQQAPAPTLDPRRLPGVEGNNDNNILDQANLDQQMSALQAQRNRLPTLNTSGMTGAKIQPGLISPTSMAFYQQLGITPLQASQLAGTESAPFFQSTFENIPQGYYPQTAALGGHFLSPDMSGLGPRRKSFTEGLSHPAAGAGTPGYGIEFSSAPYGGQSPGRVRGVGGTSGGHRRGIKSEDWGVGGTGWGVGQGGSTADFLNSITANDGTLLPPRGRSHSRHSSASSARSASPALSVSSQGSSYGGGSPRMEMPEGAQVPGKLAKLKVTSTATEVASTSRRTNEGVYKCPVPGCGSTFTRHFNLKGHLRSHNDERPYKCLYDGCPKSVVGFARQHDCKRHMLLHEGLRPFECDGCGKKFARLDALTRHHKSEQGQECAISHPLPVNPDGTAMSESQYKAYKAAESKMSGGASGGGGSGNGRGRGKGRGGSSSGAKIKREQSHSGLSAFSGSGAEEDHPPGYGSGMEEYDRV
ncbi:hypothetical protein BD324DRAFT_459889 [Kockovaella imperatae]|uniref:C2H2-type domain-containing protein n=1 Tax=Kockovaella imperatae TaxID=4999 RepID=A0A1Y1UFA6_9TREE|nr:hypothetical protein BD324DRAFT_459889 [Kockovaella imperatae]ORX36669.1 hypothetical protein BD324DRAFT_459889 [Kockovaella imperatae]